MFSKVWVKVRTVVKVETWKGGIIWWRLKEWQESQVNLTLMKTLSMKAISSHYFTESHNC